MAKPTLPQGTRDFAPEIVRKRNFILDTIREVFALYGFEPLETPAIENLETLMGKYGEEGDRLIFRILNNGLSDPRNREKARAAFENLLQGKNDTNLTERALRYDLTIPFARFVAMHQGKLNLPFKRYQIQPVWRADRPQRGRYREFYQCDADIAGSRSLVGEVEFARIYHRVFQRLGLRDYRLAVNSRKILLALAETCGAPEKLTDITVAIDKLDKIGLAAVKTELQERGLSTSQIDIISRYLAIGTDQRSADESGAVESGADQSGATGLASNNNAAPGNQMVSKKSRGINRSEDGSATPHKNINGEKLLQAAALLGDSPTGKQGLEELDFLLKGLAGSADPISIEIDFTLARGLNYYTGIIFEAKAPAQVKIGSIGGGGRYDDLTGLFGVPGIPGVGISFGVDRIYDVMEELELFPAAIHTGTQALFLYPGEAELPAVLALAESLRTQHLSCEVYAEPQKIGKQYTYAEKKNIPFVISANTAELSDADRQTATAESAAKPFRIKDIRSGDNHFAGAAELPLLLADLTGK